MLKRSGLALFSATLPSGHCVHIILWVSAKSVNSSITAHKDHRQRQVEGKYDRKSVMGALCASADTVWCCWNNLQWDKLPSVPGWLYFFVTDFSLAATFYLLTFSTLFLSPPSLADKDFLGKEVGDWRSTEERRDGRKSGKEGRGVRSSKVKVGK